MQLRVRPWLTWLQAEAAEPVRRQSAQSSPELEPAAANVSRPAAGAGSTSPAAAAPAAAAAAGAADPRGAAGIAEPDAESLERSLTSGSGGGGSRSGVSRGGSRSGGGSAGRGGGRDGGAGGGRGPDGSPFTGDSRRGRGNVSPASPASRRGVLAAAAAAATQLEVGQPSITVTRPSSAGHVPVSSATRPRAWEPAPQPAPPQPRPWTQCWATGAACWTDRSDSPHWRRRRRGPLPTGRWTRDTLAPRRGASAEPALPDRRRHSRR